MIVASRFLAAPLAFATLMTVPLTARAQAINGAGSSFAAPIYEAWGQASSVATGVKLNYQSIGSGGGINQITNRTVDFGATDMPLKGNDITAKKVAQFPTVIGGVDIIVNLPGIAPNQLKLTGTLVAAMYAGAITKWNDPKIAEINPTLTLPAVAVAPVYRADASGTTFVVTDYLSKVDPDWKSKIGAATSVKWPAGTGAKGSDGVSATVANIKGGIGYVESAYADKSHLTTVMLRNKEGQFVAPTAETFSQAAANADWSHAPNLALNLNDAPGAQSWPIESATFVLVPTDPKTPAQQAAVLKFFDWGFEHGDAVARQLGYVTLPSPVKESIKALWRSELGTDSK